MAQSFGSVSVASQDLDAIGIVVKQTQERQLGVLCMNIVQERARG
jgi:predicted transcriptional regulator YheO